MQADQDAGLHQRSGNFPRSTENKLGPIELKELGCFRQPTVSDEAMQSRDTVQFRRSTAASVFSVLVFRLLLLGH